MPDKISQTQILYDLLYLKSKKKINKKLRSQTQQKDWWLPEWRVAGGGGVRANRVKVLKRYKLPFIR